MIKAVFFDIDGTLVSFNTHTIPQSTLDALALLREKGIKVFIATGRHFCSINNLGNQIFDGYVTINGGRVLVGTDQVIYKQGIPSEDIQALFNYWEKEGEFPCAFVFENELLMNFTNEAVDEVFQMLNFPAPPIRPIEEMKEREVFQLIAFFQQEEMFALTVNVHQGIRHLAEHCRRNGVSVYFNRILPCVGEFTGNDNLAVRIDIHFAQGFNRLRIFRNFKFRLHKTFCFAIANHGTVRFCT